MQIGAGFGKHATPQSVALEHAQEVVRAGIGPGQTVNYRGSIVSFFFSRQAVGVYKCCTNVYAPPTRAYAFETEFLNPDLLPPKTPMFRDVNTDGVHAGDEKVMTNNE